RFLGGRGIVKQNTGTDALYLSLLMAGIKEGDDVIAPSYTFRATIEVIERFKAIPVLVDKGDDWQDKITERTKAVIPAHLEGGTLDWEPREGIVMIEDACQ